MVRSETRLFSFSEGQDFIFGVCVLGVKVKKGQDEVEVHAPVVVSNCGVFTTFQKLLPPEIQVKHGQYAEELLQPKLKVGCKDVLSCL